MLIQLSICHLALEQEIRVKFRSSGKKDCFPLKLAVMLWLLSDFLLQHRFHSSKFVSFK